MRIPARCELARVHFGCEPASVHSNEHTRQQGTALAYPSSSRAAALSSRALRRLLLGWAVAGIVAVVENDPPISVWFEAPCRVEAGDDLAVRG